MKKNLKLLSLVTLVTAIALFVSSCRNNNDNDQPGQTEVPNFVTVTFVSASGTEIPTQHLQEGERATEPTAPTRAWTWVRTAGLWDAEIWNNPPSLYYTFGGWLNGDTPWDFATDVVTESVVLTAVWTAPEAPIARLEGNSLVAAMTYLGSYEITENVFVLAIDQNVASGAHTIPLGRDLTIVGLGEQREIRFVASSGHLFSITSGNSLTLGENITLVGRDAHNTALVNVLAGGSLTMEEGSMITGHVNTSANGATDGDGSAVRVGGVGSNFTMNGGSITGNSAGGNTTVGSARSAGVHIAANGHFVMTGGSVQGNTSHGDLSFNSDVTLAVPTTSRLTLSQTAVVGGVSLWSSTSTAMTNRSFVIIDSDWTGSIGTLNLAAGSTVNDVILRWIVNAETAQGAPLRVLRRPDGSNVTAADVARVGLGHLSAHDVLNHSQLMATPFSGTVGGQEINAPRGFTIANSGQHIGGFIIAP